MAAEHSPTLFDELCVLPGFFQIWKLPVSGPEGSGNFSCFLRGGLAGRLLANSPRARRSAGWRRAGRRMSPAAYERSHVESVFFGDRWGIQAGFAPCCGACRPCPGLRLIVALLALPIPNSAVLGARGSVFSGCDGNHRKGACLMGGAHQASRAGVKHGCCGGS